MMYKIMQETNMQVVSMTEARNNFKAIFDAVFHDNDEVIIRRKGRENVVVIPFDEYSSMKETRYFLSNKKGSLFKICT